LFSGLSKRHDEHMKKAERFINEVFPLPALSNDHRAVKNLAAH
jgi:hypothetical protein